MAAAISRSLWCAFFFSLPQPVVVNKEKQSMRIKRKLLWKDLAMRKPGNFGARLHVIRRLKQANHSGKICMRRTYLKAMQEPSK
jgi:hypothetical protein